MEVTYRKNENNEYKIVKGLSNEWKCCLKNNTTTEFIIDFYNSYPDWVVFNIYLSKIDYEKAYSISDNYMKELLDCGNGVVTTENIFAMGRKYRDIIMQSK